MTVELTAAELGIVHRALGREADWREKQATELDSAKIAERSKVVRQLANRFALAYEKELHKGTKQ